MCSSVAKSYPTLCDPMDYSTSVFPVFLYHPDFAQTHVHRVGDAIQQSHPLLLPFPTTLSLFQHQALFQWVSSSYQVARVLIHSSADGHRRCFHVWAILKSAAVNIGVYVSFSVMVSSAYMPSSGIIGSYGRFIPSFLRNLCTVLHSGYYQFTFLPTVQEGSFFSTPSLFICL